jgi:lysylphosphatidylglycerol synthetase-like protein (DUF2156 family)
VSDAPAKTPRGWTTLYAVAFVVMVVAGLLLAIAARGFLDNLTLLWLSAGLSLGAIVLAVLALVLPRRG